MSRPCGANALRRSQRARSSGEGFRDGSASDVVDGRGAVQPRVETIPSKGNGSLRALAERRAPSAQQQNFLGMIVV
jgi:hypothetical protein